MEMRQRGHNSGDWPGERDGVVRELQRNWRLIVGQHTMVSIISSVPIVPTMKFQPLYGSHINCVTPLR